MIDPNKPFMLLKPLPLYSRETIKSKSYWIGVIGCSEEKFQELVLQNWFK